MKQRIKLKIASYLDKKKPNWCWVELVMWAMGYSSTKEAFGDCGSVYNQRCPKSCDYAYCGKCDELKKKKKNEKLSIS